MGAHRRHGKGGVDLDRFFSVMVVMNVDTDLCGDPKGVITSNAPSSAGISALSPSALGQEMGHAYGLAHSRAAASEADYMDRYDVMSVFKAAMAPPHLQRAGPARTTVLSHRARSECGQYVESRLARREQGLRARECRVDRDDDPALPPAPTRPPQQRVCSGSPHSKAVLKVLWRGGW